MSNWNHPLRTIWKIGRDAQQASAAAWIIALVAVGLVLPAGVVRCRLVTIRMQAEELPDSQSMAEETSGVLGLATGQQRRTGKDRPRGATHGAVNFAVLHSAYERLGRSRTSMRSRCGELLALNGCGASLRC